MTILDELTSALGGRGGVHTRAAAQRCLEDPTLLAEIAAGLSDSNPNLAGDCAEVLTMVAAARPDLVALHAPALGGLLGHKNTRLRWEAMHAIALSAGQNPEFIESLLPVLEKLILTDESVIVRDYAVDAASHFAASSPQAAARAYPLLRTALTAWDGKQARHALVGLQAVARGGAAPAAELRLLAETALADPRATVKKAAKALLKVLEP